MVCKVDSFEAPKGIFRKSLNSGHTLAFCFLFYRKAEIQDIVILSKLKEFSFALSKQRVIQSKPLERSARTAAKMSLLSLIFLIFSTIPKRQCCALNTCLKPHFKFDKIDLGFLLTCCWTHLSYTFTILDKILTGLLYIFCPLQQPLHPSSSGKKPFFKYSLKFLLW